MAMEDAQKAVLTVRDAQGRLWKVAAALSRLYPADVPYEGENGTRELLSRTFVEGEQSSLVDFKVVEC